MSEAIPVEHHPATLTNVEVVTFALAEEHGAERPVHLERLAVKAFEYAPGAFRWDLNEYANYIDKDKVRVSLTDAQKDKNGQLVRAVGPKRTGISKPTDAWQLTSAGTAWYVENRDRVSATLGIARPALKRAKAAQVKSRLLSSELYASFLANGHIPEDPFAFTDLLECSPDASNQVIQDRLDALLSQVRLLDEPNLVEFLEATARAHKDMVVTTPRETVR